MGRGFLSRIFNDRTLATKILATSYVSCHHTTATTVGCRQRLLFHNCLFHKTSKREHHDNSITDLMSGMMRGDDLLSSGTYVSIIIDHYPQLRHTYDICTVVGPVSPQANEKLWRSAFSISVRQVVLFTNRTSARVS